MSPAAFIEAASAWGVDPGCNPPRDGQRPAVVTDDAVVAGGRDGDEHGGRV